MRGSCFKLLTNNSFNCFMICQNCKKRTATVNHVEVINGKACAQHLCAMCANELFGGFESEVQNALLNGLFGGDLREEKICPACGLSFSEYERSGLLGCPSCYDVFNEELMPHIARIQGKTMHVGKGGGLYTLSNTAWLLKLLHSVKGTELERPLIIDKVKTNFIK